MPRRCPGILNLAFPKRIQYNGRVRKKEEIREFRKDCVVYELFRIKSPRKSTAWRRYFSEPLDDGAGRVPADRSAAGIIPGIGALLVVGPLEYGMAYIFLKQARDHQSVQLGDMFRGFQDDFGGTFLIGLMTSLFTFLWSLLFVIPGIVKAYAYSMAYYIKLDHPDYGWKACIDESRRLMDGHKWEKFVLDLSFLGWIIVGSLCLGIGMLWVTPYMEAANAQFYEYVRTCPSVMGD